jgi:subtilase family serine protease
MPSSRLSRFFPLILLTCLLTACGPIVIGPNLATTPTPTRVPTFGPAPTTLPNARTVVPSTCPSYLQGNPSCLTPQALRAVYNVEPLLQQGYTGQGQTVIDIVSFGAPTLQQDLDVFDKQFNLPPLTVQVISPIHEAPQGLNDASGWAEETELDVEIIHAIAPGAKIVVLTSPIDELEGTSGLPEFLQLEQYAVTHHLGNIISQSWGASELTLEDQQGQKELQKWNSFYQQETTQDGITFFSSSGDNGATDYADLQAKHLAKVRTTSFAPDDPWVTAVGGTAVKENGKNYSETVWNNGDGAGGGGFSRFFAMPDYQKLLPVATRSQFNNHRGVPDVSADADPNTGLAVYLSGQWSQAGGTSASAPLWAALMAIANQMAGHPLGFINPTLYKLAMSSAYQRDFYDITTGNNSDNGVSGYSAAPGWDAASGLGTPNAANLLPDLVAALK